MIGPFRADLVLHVGGRDPYAVADEAFTPILTARMPRAAFGDPEARGQRLSVTGAEVSALTRRPDGRLELRVVNPSPAPAQLTVHDEHGAPATGEVTDLRGTATGDAFEGTATVPPHRIVTLALDTPT
jgi:hypothetical protein